MNKKKIIIGIIISIILIAGIMTIILLLNNKKEEPKETIVLKDKLDVEINSEVNLLSFVSDDNKVKIVSEDEIIDTSTLGEKEVIIKYLDKDKEEEYTFKINVIDTQAPTIEHKKELSTTEGNEIDLLKDVKVIDNSKEEITAVIEGNYDINKAGTYNLKYVAEDSSKNKTEEDFTLIVNEKTKETSNKATQSSNNKSNSSSNNSNIQSNNSGKTREQAMAESQVYVDYARDILFNKYGSVYSSSPLVIDNKYPDIVSFIVNDADFWLECGEYGEWNLRHNATSNKTSPRSGVYNKIFSDNVDITVRCTNPGEKITLGHYYYLTNYSVVY